MFIVVSVCINQVTTILSLKALIWDDGVVCIWHNDCKGIASMVRKGVCSTQETLPSLHSPTPPLPRSTLASFPFRNKLCFSVALDLLKIICYSPQSNMTCSYDFPHLAMIIEEELTAEWDVQSVSSWTVSSRGLL